ncbi:MAG: hypothetical protein KKG59_03305 [Nanoarchaeota archaeon]|nr:hypothetical protein [Nanoarchaeota archaeon]
MKIIIAICACILLVACQVEEPVELSAKERFMQTLDESIVPPEYTVQLFYRDGFHTTTGYSYSYGVKKEQIVYFTGKYAHQGMTFAGSNCNHTSNVTSGTYCKCDVRGSDREGVRFKEVRDCKEDEIFTGFLTIDDIKAEIESRIENINSTNTTGNCTSFYPESTPPGNHITVCFKDTVLVSFKMKLGDLGRNDVTNWKLTGFIVDDGLIPSDPTEPGDDGIDDIFGEDDNIGTPPAP